MKVVIIAGGTPPKRELLENEMKESCIIIAADSGANCLYDYSIVPDYLLGDFDSIDKNAFDYFSKSSCIIEKHPVEKDDTDAQLALNKAFSLNASSIVLLGCTGSRLDHTLGNFGLLLQCLDNGVEASIKDSNNTIWLINKPISLNGKKGDYFSVLPYGAPIKKLTINGAKYPLNNHTLELGSSLTLSNQFLDEIVEIEFNDGILLVTKSFD
jgi:thiamine pyrophosphokinase